MTNEMQTMRWMAWERAKGELRSMPHTYYPKWKTVNKREPDPFDKAEKAIEQFIKHFEGEYL